MTDLNFRVGVMAEGSVYCLPKYGCLHGVSASLEGIDDSGR